MFASMIVALVLLGFWPQPLITTARTTVDGLQKLTAGSALEQRQSPGVTTSSAQPAAGSSGGHGRR